MKVRIIAPGKIKEKWLSDGIAEYTKRLSRYCKTEIIEVADSPDSIPVDKALQREGELILGRIAKEDLVWVMDLHGKEPTSEDIASYMKEDFVKGGSVINVVIGGSNGLSPDVVKRADRRICLGKVTLTHQMTRLILLEQIYRGFKIINNEKYHK